jgi:hypothetical protein
VTGEERSAHMYRLRMDAIKWQMRVDLQFRLSAFAAKWGIER